MHIKNTHVCVVFTGIPGLMFTKLSAGIEQVMGFIEIATARLRDVAMVTDLWRISAKIDTLRLYSVHWHSTSDGIIAKRIVVLTPLLILLHLIKIT